MKPKTTTGATAPVRPVNRTHPASPASPAHHRPSGRSRQQPTAASPVPLSVLRPADSPRTDPENAEHLRALMAAEEALPPIVVHRPTMRIVDGTYRLRAAELRQREEIQARFLDCTADEAFLYAVEANTRHGLPLTFAERTAAAERVLLTRPHWSDRAIAAVTGLSPHTVASLRRDADPGTDSPGTASSERLGRDGRVRPLSTAGARREAQRLLAGSPGSSLREIARRTGLAPATVRDVRNRMLRGEDPVPARQRAGERHLRDRTEPGAAPEPPAVRDRNGEGGAGAGGGDRGGQDPADVYRRLCGDPAMRQSETGRLLLRLLSALALSTAHWQGLATELPPHRVDTVTGLALENARVWDSFARRARAAHRIPPGPADGLPAPGTGRQ
ncbi:ParB/RepB/Spo0J family partition protein [Streptomyces sp. NPDC020875]|uniref:ParB/RepB/Spo0J family partition protein n=1 Tax=Streptomyces sp. NPDC020875 TaxID=3154898 RepID=UPI0033C02E81